MIKVKEIAYTCYPVTNVGRARKFYEQLLGLTPGTTWQDGDKAWVEYDIGPATLAISNMAADKWKPSSDGPSAALEVEDFDAAVASLREASVSFAVEPMDTGFCRMAIVLDPDGNAIGIHRRK